ncbi:ankyrin repeat domain-containing protein 13D-like isoform X2 [Corticium candelabrum]|uniref:ankyrin repeat domain-containing protein 13D-like isoform X2 n=1 Tax=Corticium candelabrum TaxID=121492 RepID=UPI002E26476E|nr:ankyrin repeat domain-containing protein 13D-like isoform X2 [Corticium candelabrum]
MAGVTFPLHHAVWADNVELLEQLIQQHTSEIETKDPRGRTPLHLAAALGRIQCARILLANNANPLAENGAHYSVLNEAVSTSKPEMVEIILQARDFHQSRRSSSMIPRLLEAVQRSTDFYVEMKWEFTSWIPFLSHMCPSDTYKIWKKGANVRVDTTLIGFDNMSWIRGNRRFVFKGGNEEAVFMEIDLDKEIVNREEIQMSARLDPVVAAAPRPRAVKSLLSKPNVSTIFPTESIAFSRCKSGLPGFRIDRVDTVCGYTTKVFSALNVEFITRTRTDHLSESDKKKIKGSGGFQKLFGISNDGNESDETGGSERARDNNLSQEPPFFESNPKQLSEDNYFNPPIKFKRGDHDIGREPEVNVSSQKFKATLWMAEDFPLSLHDQIMPIIELLAANISHFARLRDFVQLHLPGGFPVKIEIPLFHVLNASITFTNINGSETSVDGVRLEPCLVSDETVVAQDGGRHEDYGIAPSDKIVRNRRGGNSGHDRQPLVQTVNECPNDSRAKCVIDMDVFEIPSGLAVGALATQSGFDNQDECLQFAIQQSLLESSKMDNLQDTEQTSLSEDDALQRVIQQSMSMSTRSVPSRAAAVDSDLCLALQLSLQTSDEEERRRKQEEEELQMVLKMSMAQQ